MDVPLLEVEARRPQWIHCPGALEEVGGDWLLNCSGLESITYSSDMSRLRKVGDGWMSKCTKLKHVDLNGFATLEEVGDDWLRACTDLELVVLPAHMPKLKKVGKSWTPQSVCSLFDHLLYLSKLAHK